MQTLRLPFNWFQLLTYSEFCGLCHRWEFAEERVDARIARILNVLALLHGAKGMGERDFMPQRNAAAPKTNTTEQMLNWAKSMVLISGGEDRREQNT